MSSAIVRCAWCGTDPLYQAYHDTEWGVPLHDDRALFELLTLEGAQAGLSWITVLKKRDNYRRAFANFDPQAVARFGDAETAALLANPGIVSIPLAFLLGIVGTLTSRDTEDPVKAAEMEVRSLTGVGAEKAIAH